jgi:SOS-response transcriptional repressor LexA
LKPRDIIDRLLRAIGVDTQAALAEYLEVGPSKITDAIRRGAVPKAWLYQVAYKTGFSVDWLRVGTGEKMQPIYAAEARVPLYRAKFPAGPMGSVVEQGVAEEELALGVKGKARFAVPVRGQSMLPEFRDGDLVVVERTSQCRHGDFVLAKSDEDEEGTFKKLIKKRDGYVLQPLNDEFSEIPLNTKHRIIGKVVWLVRKV